MKLLLTDRRLFIGVMALLTMCYRPEVASFAAMIAVGVASTNALQAVFAKGDKK